MACNKNDEVVDETKYTAANLHFSTAVPDFFRLRINGIKTLIVKVNYDASANISLTYGLENALPDGRYVLLDLGKLQHQINSTATFDTKVLRYFSRSSSNTTESSKLSSGDTVQTGNLAGPYQAHEIFCYCASGFGGCWDTSWSWYNYKFYYDGVMCDYCSMGIIWSKEVISGPEISSKIIYLI